MHWASYFDLGIMHHTVYNTYMSLKTGDLGRFLELTDPHGSGLQVNRMYIHADYFLAFLAPLYFIYDKPETLLIFQTFAIATGALAVYFISKKTITEDIGVTTKRLLLIIFPLLYLLNPAIQRTNYFEFHAVTIATPLILWMFTAYLYKRFIAAFILGFLILTTKEQLGFSMGLFAFIEACKYIKFSHNKNTFFDFRDFLLTQNRKVYLLSSLSFLAFVYVVIVVFFVMPSFRAGNNHFALNYYTQPETKNIMQIMSLQLGKFVNDRNIHYLLLLFGQFAFIPLFSIYFIPAIPDLLINILSANINMQDFYYHYTAVISPWLIISLIYGVNILKTKFGISVNKLLFLIMVGFVYFAYLESPLPFSKRAEPLYFGQKSKDYDIIKTWSQKLNDYNIKVSSTGHYAPFFTNRRYFYDFGKQYKNADYIFINTEELNGFSEVEDLKGAYAQLSKDTNFELIYSKSEV
ncbi:MAG: DUF2079 domain-containing protein [Patescibacteria group bacterium]